jgi:hypothetical protein
MPPSSLHSSTLGVGQHRHFRSWWASRHPSSRLLVSAIRHEILNSMIETNTDRCRFMCPRKSHFGLFLVDMLMEMKMAEEVKNASKVVPRAIQISVLLNGTLGLAMLIAYLFCLGDLDDVLASSATLGYPYLYVFLKGTGSAAGAATMAMIMWTLGVCCLVGLMAATSRQMWSFARDNALPFSAQVTKVEMPLPNHVKIVKLTLAAQPSNADPSQHHPDHGCNLGIALFHRTRLVRRLQQHCQSQYRRPLRLIFHRLRFAPVAASQGHQPIQRASCDGRA